MVKIILLALLMVLSLPQASAQTPPQWTFSHNAPLTSFDWSPDATLLATTASSSIYLWDMETGELRYQLPHNSPVLGVRWSPQGERFVSWSAHEVRIWERQSTRILLALFPSVAVHQILWSQEGSQLLVADDNGAAWWDAKSGEVLARYVQEGGFSRVAWNADGTRLWGSHQNTWSASIWDMTRHGTQTEPLFTYFEGFVREPRWFGNKIIDFNYDGDAALRDITQGQVLFLMPHDSYGVFDGLWSVDGTQILTWSPFDELTRFHIWDAASGKVITTWDLLDFPYPFSVTWNGEQAAAMSVSSVYVWDTDTGELLATLPYEGGISAASTDIAWSQDKRFLLTASEGNRVASLWRTSTWQKYRDFEFLTSATWSPDGEWIVGFTHQRQTLLLWRSS